MYAETRADDLVVRCIRELLRRHPSLPPHRVDDVAIAATTQTGDQGLTIGRTAALLAGLPKSVPGYAIDRMCAGAMTAVTTAASGIAFGAYDVVVAGGVEHMGHHPMGEGVDPNPRFLAEKIVDPSALVMGQTAENLHDRYPHLTQERADAYAAASQEKLAKAYANGKVQPDLVPVATRSTDKGYGLATKDEPPRPGTTVEELAALKTPFRPHGRITAGNAAGLNDGATACLLADEATANELGLPVRMRLVSYAFAGVEPEVMGVGPIPSTERALERAGLSIGDIGLFELNEAFAVQVLTFLEHFGIADDDPRVNEYGGAIAGGPPARRERRPPDDPVGPPVRGSPRGPLRAHGHVCGHRDGRLGHLGEPALRRRWQQVTTAVLEFPDEVVTQALVQYVELPLGAGTAALLTLDNGFDHTKPTTFGPQGLRNIDAAVEAALARDDVVAVCVTGKPFIFAVGADLKVVSVGGSREHALELGRLGHRVFRRLKDARVPSFAFVNGAAMGGGLEIALHCSYRTISSGVPCGRAARVLPRPGSRLGWVAAAAEPRRRRRGGHGHRGERAQPEPHAVGPAAFKLGIADAMFEPADFLEQSLVWAAQVVRGQTTVDRRDVDRGDAWEAAVARGRSFVDAKLHGATPAPYRALELIELARTASFEDGTAAEDEALADLAFGDDLRASLYAFDLVQRRAKRPSGRHRRTSPGR
jgi:acetyl-CoA acyltransferase